MTAVVTLLIRPDGSTHCIYSDAAAELASAAGNIAVARASHIEPDPKTGEWVVDMSPSGGPAELGRWPLHKREEALAAEVAWLHANVFQITA